MGAADGNFRGECCPVVVGPTAVGKTGLVAALAAQLPVQVISLDSRQIYQGLRIGTAQPTAQEQQACPHHLIDFVSPLDKYSAMRFREDFARVYRDLRGRGIRPLLAGGAGMYLTALRDGFLDVPGTSPQMLAAVRARLNLLADPEIRQQLEAVDPESFAAIHPNDRYRSQRALEIHQISGIPMSTLKARQKPDPCLGLRFPTVVLERPVPELDARIARRTEEMLATGWLEETEEALGRFPARCPGLKSIGYREIVDHLQGRLPRNRLEAAIVLVTRQYAKRQRTWFRHVPHASRSHPDDPQLVPTIRQLFQPS